MNMQRLSRLHRDKPMKPMDSALFWIEFVMRHKGAAHLRTESYRLPWYSYHSVDVMLFLAGITLLIFMTFAALVRCLCSRCVRAKIKQELKKDIHSELILSELRTRT
ncbi:UDP-glucuronosyltransferase 2B17 [Takifugu flavidus]|uniref:UDP-glucuronosyltransferase 2B17 n=1 Tax=Takifugu flavidus TaxID=433684 RepID=A0A5C6MCR0_9TELE|nr:UDP-glucuronosyltransferase 2B17 [Takifugu flavidus]